MGFISIRDVQTLRDALRVADELRAAAEPPKVGDVVKVDVRRSEPPRQSAKRTLPKPGISNIIASESVVVERAPLIDAGKGLAYRKVQRVRIQQITESSGMTPRGEVVKVTTIYLDGTMQCAMHYPQKIDYRSTTMAASAIPARSKDVTDFGRLETAVATLVSQVRQYDADKDEDGMQMQSFLASYQGILEWKRKAQEQFDRAEGQIDLVARAIRDAVGVLA